MSVKHISLAFSKKDFISKTCLLYLLIPPIDGYRFYEGLYGSVTRGQYCRTHNVSVCFRVLADIWKQGVQIEVS